MSYQVLARKWRPHNFLETVGQEHVLQALVNALDNDRLHHAYLFTGTRGVGKTTIARILAKSLNCETGVTSTPCGTCSACREIDEGRFIDLIEVDAASRTKVEDTRELLDNVQYAPTRGRYKVYLIDEVHMLSSHSFNALLKTLEEPPPHVKFLLATTDPQKLPITILSRCLQFSLKRMMPEQIQGHLQHILTEEQISFEPMALNLISVAADGSMRDSLSLLDQAIAFCGGEVLEEAVRTMLGTIDRKQVYSLLDALSEQNGEQLLKNVASLTEQAPDFAAALGELTSVLHQIAIAQTVPNALNNQIEQQRIEQLAAKLSPEDVQLFYQIALTGRRDLPLAPTPKEGFEMVLLRMLAFRPMELTNSQKPAVTPSPRTQQTPPASAEPALQIQSSPAQYTAPVQATSATTSTAATQQQPGDDNQPWPILANNLPLHGMAKQVALNCILTSKSENRIVLSLDEMHKHLLSKKIEDRLQEALSSYLQKTIALQIEIGTQNSTETPAAIAQTKAENRQEQADQAIANDPNVKKIIETFDGRIIPDSTRPND